MKKRVIKRMVITLLKTRQDFRDKHFEKNRHQKTRGQTNLKEKQKQEGNTCDYMVTRGK